MLSALFCDPMSGSGESTANFPAEIFPFTLGEEFTFGESMTVMADGFSARDAYSGGAMGLTYYLTDANGNVITPYMVTPEPETGLTFLFAFALIAVAKLRR